MGYIRTEKVERIIRKLLRKNAVLTFSEIVKKGFPIKGSLSYADELAKHSGDIKQRRWQFDIAVGCTLYRYHRSGLIYPTDWRENLEVYLSTAEDIVDSGAASGPTLKADSTDFDEEAIKATVAAMEKTEQLIPYLPMLAGPIRRTLSQCGTEVPPWIEAASGSAETADWRACRAALIADHPFDDIIYEYRKIAWKAAPTLWTAPFIGDIDL